MKANLVTSLIIGTVFVGLTACKGKDDGGNQATIPGLPQGRVASMYNGTPDNNNYCEFSADQHSMTCTTVQTYNGGQPQVCSAPPIQFTDMTTFCANVNQALQNNNYNSAVGVCGRNAGMSAMQYMYSQHCGGLNGSNTPPPPPTLPNQIPPVGSQTPPVPGQWAQRVIQCSYNSIYETRNGGQATSTANLSVSGVNPRGTIFDERAIPRIKVSYDRRTDSISIATLNTTFKQSVSAVQTGYAGQEVRLEVKNNDQSLDLTVSCTDVSEQRTVNQRINSYKCEGRSRLGSRTEKVNKLITLDRLMNDEIELADGLTLRASNGSSGLNNALVTVTANSPYSDVSILSSAYINAPLHIQDTDGRNSVDVTCKPIR